MNTGTLFIRTVVRNIPSSRSKQFILLAGFELPLVQRTASIYETIGNADEYNADEAGRIVESVQTRTKAGRVVDVTSEDVQKRIAKFTYA